jgi:MFS family permease
MTPAGSSTRLLTPAFIVLAAADLAFFISAGIVLPVASRFAEGPLAAGQAGVGVAIASFSLAAIVMRPVVGWASDRFGRRPLLLGGAAMSVLALLLHVPAGTLPAFIAVRGLLGVAEGFFFVAAMAAATDLSPETRRGEAISFFSLSLYLGLAIGPLIGEAILAGASYTTVWLAAAGVSLLTVGLAALIPETAPAVKAGERRPRGRLIHPAGLFPGLLVLTGAWGMAGYLAFVALHARNVGLGGAGTPLAIYSLIVVALRIVGARLPDRFGAVRLSGSALVLTAAGLAICGLAPNEAGLLAGTVVYSVGVAFLFPAMIAMAVNRVVPEERGSVVGTTSAFLDIGFGIAPIVLGFVAERTGYPGTFLVSAIVAGLGASLLFARRATVVAWVQPAGSATLGG